MIKIVQTEPEPGCLFCMDLSKIEFYGSLKDGIFDEITSEDEVSIIGRVKRE